MADKSETSARALFYNNSFVAKQAVETFKRYGHPGIEKALLLLHTYNLRSLGVDDAGTTDGSLLKEMVVKIINN
jgi:DNA polymerase-3 subunit delta